MLMNRLSPPNHFTPNAAMPQIAPLFQADSQEGTPLSRYLEEQEDSKAVNRLLATAPPLADQRVLGLVLPKLRLALPKQFRVISGVYGFQIEPLNNFLEKEARVAATWKALKAVEKQTRGFMQVRPNPDDNGQGTVALTFPITIG